MSVGDGNYLYIIQSYLAWRVVPIFQNPNVG
jgi:hypothetical protein